MSEWRRITFPLYPAPWLPHPSPTGGSILQCTPIPNLKFQTPSACRIDWRGDPLWILNKPSWVTEQIALKVKMVSWRSFSHKYLQSSGNPSPGANHAARRDSTAFLTAIELSIQTSLFDRAITQAICCLVGNRTQVFDLPSPWDIVSTAQTASERKQGMIAVYLYVVYFPIVPNGFKQTAPAPMPTQYAKNLGLMGKIILLSSAKISPHTVWSPYRGSVASEGDSTG